MPARPSALALALWLLVAVAWAVTEAHHPKRDAPTQEPTTTEEPHHKPLELRHFHHHHRHYHHYRDRSKHWVAGLLLSLVGAVLGSCAAVGLWRRFCARRPTALQLQGAPCFPFGRRVTACDTPPLLQPPPLPAPAAAKDAPPPYKETWA